MMLPETRRDTQTVTPEGTRVEPLIDGVTIRYAVTHTDERGTLTEVYNPAWGFHEAPLVYVYQFTVRPGKIKGWVVHERQEDRIFLGFGSVKIVLFDNRLESSTYRMINEIYLSEHQRGLILYPRGVYHAIQNVGETDAILFNMPTIPYIHDNPDKYRLPLNTELIPYSFDTNQLGW